MPYSPGLITSNPTHVGGNFNPTDMSPSPWATFIYQASGDAARNQFTAEEAEKARAFNSAEAAKQRNFEEFMSNTAYSRAVADMRSAGINPMMAAGAAASTPSGVAASAPGSAASAQSSFNPASLVAKIAAVAISKGLAAKFTNSALAAADNHQLVTAKIKALAAQEQKALTASGVDLSKVSDSKQETKDVMRFLRALSKM